MYACSSCKREIEKFENFVRCPYCAARLVDKPSLPVARNVKAR